MPGLFPWSRPLVTSRRAPKSEARPGEGRYDIPPYYQGWFQIAWSDDLRRGEVRKIKHFGQEYALFRKEDGALGLLDDICPHLGAHFSEGGQVVNGSLRCPYHHWSFDAGGQCTNIPYAKKIPSKARVGSHTVVEKHGLIFMYRDALGGPPPYPLPEIDNFDPSEYTSPRCYEFTIRIHGQDIMENSVDSAHFYAVHGHDMPTNIFETRPDRLVATQLTSVKRYGLHLKSKIIFHLVEPGFHYVEFPENPGAEAHVFSSIVPVDEEYTVHRLTVRVKKSAVPGWSQLVRHVVISEMMRTYREDMQIWESKSYLSRPILCDGDGAIMKLRKWFKKFHDPM